MPPFASGRSQTAFIRLLVTSVDRKSSGAACGGSEGGMYADIRASDGFLSAPPAVTQNDMLIVVDAERPVTVIVFTVGL